MRLGLLTKIMPTDESQKYAEIVPVCKDLPILGFDRRNVISIVI